MEYIYCILLYKVVHVGNDIFIISVCINISNKTVLIPYTLCDASTIYKQYKCKNHVSLATGCWMNIFDIFVASFMNI